MKIYEAEFEDNEIETFEEVSNKKAIQRAFEYEEEHGILFNVTLLDDNYNPIKTVY